MPSKAQLIQNKGILFAEQQEINTYPKADGCGFKISPEVLEFKRNIIAEYEIVP